MWAKDWWFSAQKRSHFFCRLFCHCLCSASTKATPFAGDMRFPPRKGMCVPVERGAFSRPHKWSCFAEEAGEAEAPPPHPSPRPSRMRRALVWLVCRSTDAVGRFTCDEIRGRCCHQPPTPQPVDLRPVPDLSACHSLLKASTAMSVGILPCLLGLPLSFPVPQTRFPQCPIIPDKSLPPGPQRPPQCAGASSSDIVGQRLHFCGRLVAYQRSMTPDAGPYVLHPACIALGENSSKHLPQTGFPCRSQCLLVACYCSR